MAKKNRVVYNVTADGGLEEAKFGQKTTWGTCVRAIRFGRPLVDFVASSAQVKSLRAGKKVRVTADMIDTAHYFCRGSTFAGARRKRRRR